MNQKQFLKPSWEKLLFTILISMATYSASPGPLTVPVIGEILLSPYLLFNQLLPGIEFEYPNFLWIIGIFYIYPLIFWYLLSCLVAWIYNKIRENW